MWIVIICILLVPGLIFMVGKSLTERRERAYIMELYSLLDNQSGKIYHEDQLKDLPEPVQRYFKYALKDGQVYVSSVYLKHDGQFKTALDKSWIDIEGEQHFTIENPGFLWRGKTSLFSALDIYIGGKGRMVVFLLSLFRIIDLEGEKYDQGELLRWLGESVWFPTNLLPSPRLEWIPLDVDRAILIFRYNGLELEYIVSFNDKGEIIQLETRRFMGEDEMESWIGSVSDYQERGGMMIPMKIEALWKLNDGEHSYARFIIRDIEHK